MGEKKSSRVNLWPDEQEPHTRLCMIPCSYWASTSMAALPSCITLYAVPVRQARGLPVSFFFPPHPASFRFRLATDTLAFGYLLPATGRIRVFHPLETCAAGRTMKNDDYDPLIAVVLIEWIIPAQPQPDTLLPFRQRATQTPLPACRPHSGSSAPSRRPRG